MPIAKVYSLKNEEVGEIELNDQVFGAPVNKHLMWEAVNHFLATGRAGTASTKTRAEVAGSGRKLWKQKGTGRARVGDIRTPKWRGGGTVHGPKPRDFSYAFPKKKRRGALRCALSDKLANGGLKIVENWDIESHKTKAFIQVMNGLQLEGRSLVIDDRENLNLTRASNNLPDVKFVAPFSLNIHDILKYENVVVTKDAVIKIQEVLNR